MTDIPLLGIHPQDKGGAVPTSDYIDTRVLAANTAETVTVPQDADSKYANYVYLTPNADIYIKRTGTAAVAAADVTDGSGSELLPAGRPILLYLGAQLASFSIITAATSAIVSLKWFK